MFVDGDYWHGNNWSWRKSKLARGHNGEYWVAKIERNRCRDKEVNEALQRMGWTVVRVWESEINEDVDDVATRIRTLVFDVDGLHRDVWRQQ